MAEGMLDSRAFQKGEQFKFADFMEVRANMVVWGESKVFNGPLLVVAIDQDQKSIVLTDGDQVGVSVEFPQIVEPDSHVAAFTGKTGMMNFFEALPLAGKG